MATARHLAAAAALALPILASAAAFAQAPPLSPPPAKPPAAKHEKTPDAEYDPDAKPKEPPPLPPADPNAWGVGGKEEEGKFAPGGENKKKAEQEARKKQAEEDKKPIDLGLARAVTLDTVIGFGSMRDITHDGNRTKTSGVSFVFGFDWRVAEIWTLTARFPFTRASAVGPTDAFNTFAAGNLELGVRPSFQVTRRLRIPAQLSIFIPTAQGDFFPDPTAADKKVPIAQGLMNQFASWSRGWEDMPLFASKRFGARLAGGIDYRTDAGPGSLHIAASTGFDLMLKTGGGTPADDPSYMGFILSGTSYAWVTHASAHYALLDGKVEPGLRAWLAVTKLPISTASKDYGGAQLVFEPQVNTRWPLGAEKSMAIRGGLGLILPAGGSLGGAHAPNNASIKGFRINAGFEF